MIRRLAALAAGALAVAACAGEAPATQASVDTLAIMERVADWQIENMDYYKSVEPPVNGETFDPRGWVQGPFLLGLAELAEISDDARYGDFVIARGEAEGWRLGDRKLHADDHLVGQAYLWAYERTGDAAALAPMRAQFDEILADPPTVDLAFETTHFACQERWCWCDALFMSPPTWTQLTEATGDAKYLAYADAEFWATTDYLYDTEEHLYYRDSRFIGALGENGRKIFWSRGNGWVFAGLVHMLESVPADHPSYARYETVFKEMAAKLVSIQMDNGYWSSSLLAADLYPTPESSGTAFYTYGLAWGVNHGLLDRDTYGPAVERGWAALIEATGEDGKLHYVQQIGDAPDAVREQDTQFYAVGGVLLAGSEMLEFARGP